MACWGQNADRELGDGTWDNHPRPLFVPGIVDAIDLSVFEYGTCVARRGGPAMCWGSPWGPGPVEVAGLHDVTRISAWKGTACGIRRDHSVVCAGSADGDGESRVAVGPFELPGIHDAVDLGVSSSAVCVLHACGRVSCGARYWIPAEGGKGPRTLKPLSPVGGVDDARQLVMASYINSIQYERACVLRANGRVSCWSPTSGVARAPEPLGDDSDFVGLGGGQGICAFNAAGRTKCFGPTLVIRENVSDPELPDEATLEYPMSVTSGGAFRCAALASEKIACWGRELGGITDELLVPMPVGKLKDAAQVSVGRFHTCVTRTNGEVGCFGPVQSVTVGGDDGSGGYSYSYGQTMAGLHFMAEVAAGDGFYCARTKAGEVFCAGRNDKGQLGDGPRREDRQLPTPIVGVLDATSVVAAPTYACALREKGEVDCWGGHPLSDRLGVRPAPIPELAGAVELAAGDHHTCARLPGGRITCIGAAPALSRDGSPDIVQIVAGAKHTCVLLKSGHVACAGAPDPVIEDLPEPAVFIAAGGDETCAVTMSGRVSCWGGKSVAAPWLLVTKAKRVATTGKHACALLQSGELLCWGESGNGVLGQGPSDVRYPPTWVPFGDPR